MKKIIFIFFISSLIIYFFTSAPTPYNHFILLADALLKGKLYVTGIYPWLEKVPINANNFYVVAPPMPAILALPFVFIFGKAFPQNYLANIAGAGIVVLTICISWVIKKDYKLAIWSGILTGFGTIIWFMSATGSVWFFGQTTSAFFLTLAIYESLTRKRLFIVGICIGAIYLSRPHVILVLPLLLFLLKEKLRKLDNLFKFVIGAVPFFLFGFGYNFFRFGSIFDKAYFLLPELFHETQSPWFVHGVENIVYIPNNLRTIFWSFPKILKNFPYLEPSWNGLAIWITTPAFIYSLKASIKESVVKISWLTILLISLVVFSHGGNGFAQFGYRFAVDFYPILIFLTIKGVAKKGLKWHHWFLLVICILVNLWGVLWINKFGWVSY
jgi:hypothetical protein